MTTIQNIAAEQQPFLYAYGCIASNDATTPNTVIDMTAGQVRDSNDVMDIVISTAMTINAAVNGYNGLDTGTLAASTMYDIYAIADSRNFNPTGYILTLNSNSVPLMPFEYDSMRLVGHWATDGSSHFLVGYTSGNSNLRSFTYDAFQLTAVTAGNATSYTAIDLTGIVPLMAAVVNIPVLVSYGYTPAAAGHGFYLNPVNGTSGGNAALISGQVASVVMSNTVYVNAQRASNKPEISYKVSNGSDAVSVSISGYQFSI